jgi:hypothetical protein
MRALKPRTPNRQNHSRRCESRRVTTTYLLLLIFIRYRTGFSVVQIYRFSNHQPPKGAPRSQRDMLTDIC